MKFNRELMKGHLKTIVLSALSDGPCHAYGLKKRIQEKSLDVFSAPEGTVYPTLHKLEKDGLIESKIEESRNGREIRNYSITSKGKKTLEDNRREWHFFSQAMKLMLKSESE